MHDATVHPPYTTRVTSYSDPKHWYRLRLELEWTEWPAPGHMRSHAVMTAVPLLVADKLMDARESLEVALLSADPPFLGRFENTQYRYATAAELVIILDGCVRELEQTADASRALSPA